MYKPATLRIAESLDIRCPPWTQVSNRTDPTAEASRIVRQLGKALFVKPSSGGGSLGAGPIDDSGELEAFIRGLPPNADYIACRRIDGTDVSVGLLTIDGQLTCLSMLATYPDAAFYDYEVKHNSALRRHECPAVVPKLAHTHMETTARRVFEAMPCSNFARIDFLIDAQGVPWFLEVNTLPGMSRQGNFSTMAAAHGLSYTELVSTMLASHIESNGYRP